MKHYKIYISDTAQEDLDELFYHIVYEYKAYPTAQKYLNGLRNAIQELHTTAEIYPLQSRRTLQQYGPNVRRINYKKMAIIYTIHTDLIYIHRIIPQSHIAGL